VATAVIMGRVELSRHNLNPMTTAMTEDKIAPGALLEKGSEATFFCEMSGFTAEQLLQLETEGLCGVARRVHAEERNQRKAIVTVTGRPGRERLSSALPNSVVEVTFWPF
jgi:hypothetical protein